jgi:arylamine N-acetyltransferase
VNSSSDSARLVPLLHNHMVLFVQLPSPSPESPNSVPDQIYLTDVGFGGIYGMSGLVRPIPLIPSISHPGSAPPEEHRLEIGSHPDSVLDSDEYWLLQARCGRPEWKTFYLFKLQEFYLGDFQEFSLSVSRPGAGVISSLVIVVKSAVLGKPEVDNDANPLQRYMVAGDKYVKRVGDQVEVLKVFQNEEERMEAIMSEECGIVIDDKEEALKSIEGKVSMLQDAGISANNF